MNKIINMGKYRIHYNYNTGDSFHSELGVECYLDEEYTNLDIAKENVKRIKQHYEYYEKMNNLRSKSHKEVRGQYSREDWYSEKYDFVMKIQADNGNFYEISAPWCGYFESLNSVEVKLI